MPMASEANTSGMTTKNSIRRKTCPIGSSTRVANSRARRRGNPARPRRSAGWRRRPGRRPGARSGCDWQAGRWFLPSCRRPPAPAGARNGNLGGHHAAHSLDRGDDPRGLHRGRAGRRTALPGACDFDRARAGDRDPGPARLAPRARRGRRRGLARQHAQAADERLRGTCAAHRSGDARAAGRRPGAERHLRGRGRQGLLPAAHARAARGRRLPAHESRPPGRGAARAPLRLHLRLAPGHREDRRQARRADRADPPSTTAIPTCASTSSRTAWAGSSCATSSATAPWTCWTAIPSRSPASASPSSAASCCSARRTRAR